MSFDTCFEKFLILSQSSCCFSSAIDFLRRACDRHIYQPNPSLRQSLTPRRRVPTLGSSLDRWSVVLLSLAETPRNCFMRRLGFGRYSQQMTLHSTVRLRSRVNYLYQ